MTTADWALIVSLCSLTIALGSFVWNVWQKFIYPKPIVVVSVAKMVVFQGGASSQPHVSLQLVNHGPNDTTINNAIIQSKKHRFDKIQWALLNPIHNFPMEPYVGVGPFGGGLPKQLKVGESFTLRFPYEDAAFLRQPIFRIGVNDIFGRTYWAPRRQLRKLLKNFREDDEGSAPERDAGEYVTKVGNRLGALLRVKRLSRTPR
jgi:hypothetical protein